MARHKLVASFWEEPVGPPLNYIRHRHGAVIEISDEHAERLVRLGAVVPVDLVDEQVDAQAAALSGWLAAEAEWQSDVDAESNLEPEGQDGSPSEPGLSSAAPVERPKQAAPKHVWVEYAVSCGFDRDNAEELDKRDLIAQLD